MTEHIWLEPDDWPVWLDPGNTNRPLLESMLEPCPDDALQMEPA